MSLERKIQKAIYSLGQQLPLLSDREISRRLKVSRDAAAKYRGPFPTEEAAEQAEAVEACLSNTKAMERLRLENTRLRGLNRVITRSGMTTESIMDQFSEFLRTEEAQNFQFTPRVYPAPDPVEHIFDPDHEEIATLVLSDWHCGETVRPEETNGVNKFNSVVLANRVYALVDKFKKIVRGHQQMYKITKVWLPLLGDFLNGSIHPEFLLTNDLLDIPAAVLVARLLIMAIEEIKTLGLPIEIDGVVGNHPRLVPTMPSKRQAQLSLDWVVYKFLEAKYEDDPQVTIRVHQGQFGIVEMYGHRIALEHGYKAKAGEGLHDRVRRMLDSPISREATGLQGTSVSMVIIGDKHRAQSGDGYLVNGCLPGQGEYGIMLRLDPIPASQWMFGISPAHVKTYQYQLDVTSVVSEEAENPMSGYATKFMKEHGR